MAKITNGTFIDDTPVNSGVTDIAVGVSGSESGPTANDSEFAEFDPASTSTTGGGSGGSVSSGTGKRRGRPPGSTNKTTVGTGQKKTKDNLGGIETVLLTIHFGLAAVFETPELELGADEAKALSDGLANVAATYDHNMNPRTLAWIQLAIVAGGIYGTRVFAIKNRQSKETQKTEPARVVDINTRKSESKTVGAPGTNQGSPLTPADIFGLNYGGAIPEGV